MAFLPEKLAKYPAKADTVSQHSSAGGRRLIVRVQILTTMQQIADDNIRTVSQRKTPAANKSLLIRHLGTLQFLMLTAFFVVPLFPGIYIPEVEYLLPPVRKSQQLADELHVWHLQVSMDEEVKQKNDKPKRYSWTVAFPLPLSSR